MSRARQPQPVQQAMPCEVGAVQSLQSMMGKTFERVLTRARALEYDTAVREEKPCRLDIFNASRSEHTFHWRRMQQRREVDNLGVGRRPGAGGQNPRL